MTTKELITLLKKTPAEAIVEVTTEGLIYPIHVVNFLDYCGIVELACGWVRKEE
jgi:hypothetical protein